MSGRTSASGPDLVTDPALPSHHFDGWLLAGLVRKRCGVTTTGISRTTRIGPSPGAVSSTHARAWILNRKRHDPTMPNLDLVFSHSESGLAFIRLSSYSSTFRRFSS